MKENRIQRPRKHLVIAVLAITVLAGAAIGLVIGYDHLRDLWLEQCEIRDFHEQVSISSGKMVKADVLAENFGLKNGANLALIDFPRKREEILRKIPNLKSITITRRLPDGITIVAEEREPIARLNVHGKRAETGKVIDAEGVVFICQRGTQLLPVIREAAGRTTAVGQRLEGRARAALEFLDACRGVEFQELGVLEADISSPDFIMATLGSAYSRAKIAWQGMDECTPASHASLVRQLTMLLQAIRTGAGRGAAVWNATDLSTPGRIYADMKGNQQ